MCTGSRSEAMEPTTLEGRDVPVGRFAAADNHVRQPPPDHSRATGPSQTRIVFQIILVIVGVALGLWALYRLASLVLVLILAALFAYVIAPLVQLAERPIRLAGRSRRLPRPAAI